MARSRSDKKPAIIRRLNKLIVRRTLAWPNICAHRTTAPVLPCRNRFRRPAADDGTTFTLSAKSQGLRCCFRVLYREDVMNARV